MNSAERETVATAAKDLRFLATEWDQSVDDDSLRRSSTTLRLLLVGGVYGRAWRLVGFQGEPKVVAPDLEANLAGLDQTSITWAHAGGAESQGITVEHPMVMSRAMSPEEVKRRFERGREPVTSTYGLSRFLESTCVLYGDVAVRRREIILYVANKLGGAHLDAKRDPIKDRVAIALDETLNTFGIGGRPAIYFEVLSIGQALVRSEDAIKFDAAANAVLSGP
jgi:hypothetical protein